MLRLSPPGRQLLLQTPALDVWVGGAEANVATQLARLGHDVSMVSRVPDNVLGQEAVAVLRGHGVDTRDIAFGGDRIGLYFATIGAGKRPTDVIYDRAGSAFAEAPGDTWNWDMLLEGVDRLHLSGITPALGQASADHAIAAAEAATSRGISVSFDGNWRGKLWARWNADPQPLLLRIMHHADLLFGNHRDIALLLKRDVRRGGTTDPRHAAEQAFAAFPRLQTIASTERHADQADSNRLSARIDTRDSVAQTPEVMLTGIVDRIGAGDAFAAGVLHALRCGGSTDDAAQTGLALAALKHSLPGDAALFRQADIDGYLAGGLDVRR